MKKTFFEAREGICIVKGTSLEEVAGKDYIMLAFLLMIEGMGAIQEVVEKYPRDTEEAMAAVYASNMLVDEKAFEDLKEYFCRAMTRVFNIINQSNDDAKKLRLMPLLPKLLVRSDDYHLSQSLINEINEAMDRLMLEYCFYIYDFGFTYSALCMEGGEKYVC
ncbi:MAG: hypothetical protein IJ002_08455 [Clostridia bacterium]|nr:hypothetical protein [Clostridia bacterium]